MYGPSNIGQRILDCGVLTQAFIFKQNELNSNEKFSELTFIGLPLMRIAECEKWYVSVTYIYSSRLTLALRNYNNGSDKNSPLRTLYLFLRKVEVWVFTHIMSFFVIVFGSLSENKYGHQYGKKQR